MVFLRSIFHWLHPALAAAMLGSGCWAILARKHARSSHPIAGEVYFWLLLATGVTGLVIGTRHPGLSVFQIATPPTLALGLLGYTAVKLKPPDMLGRPWLRWHILGMGGSYIGAVTATGFQIFPRFLPRSMALTTGLFVVPAVIGTVLIRRATSRWLPKATARAA